MRTFDFSPLMRSSVGFDRMTDLMEDMLHFDEFDDSYPPYNIEKLDDEHYRIALAVAGFEPDELDVTVQDNGLFVAAEPKESDEPEPAQYLHRGIARRAFRKRFNLADHIQVTGARLENGMLLIDLVQELPEAMKPRKIEIESASDAASRSKIGGRKKTLAAA